MAASIRVRTALVRFLCRKSVTSAASSTANSSLSSRTSTPSLRSGSALRYSAVSSSSRYLRRELSSLLPLHSAVASASLISKLPDDAVSFEGRFVNYLSPI